MDRLKRFDLLILMLLLLLQLAICIPFLESYPVELDEPFTIYYSSRPLSETISVLSEGNNPPLYFIVQHYWQSIFGIEPLAVRSLSLLFSLITISVFYFFVRKRSHLLIAIGACLVLIFTDSFHHFSIEARMFQMFLLFSFLALTSLYKFLFEANQKQLIYAVFWIVMTLYTHYLGIFILLILVMLFMIYNERVKGLPRRYYFRSIGLFIALMLPILYTLVIRGSDFVAEGSWLMMPNARDFVEEIFKMFNTPFNFIFFLLFNLILVSMLRNLDFFKKDSFIFFFLAGTLLYVGMFLFSLMMQPVFLERYLFVSFLFALPFLIAFEDLDLKRSKLKYFFLGIAIPFIVSLRYVPDTNRNTETLIADIEDIMNEGYEIYFCPEHFDLLLAYYLLNDFNNYTHEELLVKMNRKGFYADCTGELVLERLPSDLFYIDFNLEYLYPDLMPSLVIGTEYNLMEEQTFKGGYKLKKYRN